MNTEYTSKTAAARLADHGVRALADYLVANAFCGRKIAEVDLPGQLTATSSRIADWQDKVNGIWVASGPGIAYRAGRDAGREIERAFERAAYDHLFSPESKARHAGQGIPLDEALVEAEDRGWYACVDTSLGVELRCVFEYSADEGSETKHTAGVL